MTVQERVLSLSLCYDMLPSGATVLCALSGGADSVCLLHLLTLRQDLTVSAAHYNHRLRGAEANRDETFVRELCRRWGVLLTVGHGDVAHEAKARKQGIEETAREMRYRFLYETAEKVGAERIATAHNADDNLETMLLHLIRGAGLQGLTGIPPRQGALVRPLLSVTRKEIEAYLLSHDLPHTEDSTNSDQAYSRNKMRRQVLPLLEGFNPALRENSVDALRYLRADNDYLNARAAELSSRATVEDGEVSLPAALIAQVPDPIAVRAARQLLTMTPPGSTDCAGAHLEAMVALCRGDDPSGEIHLPHGLTARRVYGDLILTHDRPRPPLEPVALRQGENPVPGTEWIVILDGSPWPGLVVRSRQVGDQLALPGRPGKSLKRLMIDQRFPRWERDNLPVVADDTGVLAVAGLGPNTLHPRFDQVQIIQKERGEGQ